MNGWKKFFLFLICFAFWMVGLVVVGNWGYAGQYFWSSGSALCVGFAVAPFWHRRSSRWYWPTVVFLILANFVVLYFERNLIAYRNLPAKGIVQGIFVVDCMTCWALMVGIAYLCERKFPWSDDKTNE